MSIQSRITDLLGRVNEKTAEDIIKIMFQEFGSKITFASSLGEEDQVITDIIARVAPGIRILLDTGRFICPKRTLIAKTKKKYPQLSFNVYYPDTKAVEAMVNERTLIFYESVDNRKIVLWRA